MFTDIKLYLKILYFNIFFLLFFSFSLAQSESNRLIISSTTSTVDSGLASFLIEIFESEFNYSVHVLSHGTGQAIQIAKKGNADLLIVHNEKLEEEFMESGHGVKRYKLMYNNFFLVGSIQNPAKIETTDSIFEAMKKIHKSKSTFISRGDISGTHLKEMYLWKESNLDMASFGPWYKVVGQGMGATLNIANNLGAYTLVDSGTWISFGNKDNLAILFEEDDLLKNQYSIILVNPEKHPNVNQYWGNVFIKWILSNEGSHLINAFRVNNKQLFIFNGEKI